MNSDKCKGCEWYGKPYWSINNPCDNCPRDNIQVITRWEDQTIEQLQQENKQLKERIEYLERSNNRREDGIISLRQELIDSEVCREKAIEYIEKHQYRWYDLNGEEYIEPTEFDKNVNPKILLEILKGEDNE